MAVHQKGGAFGFKLDTLTKLKNSKGADNQTTLLQFVIQYVQKKMPKLLTFTEDLKSVGEASRIETPVLLGEINKVKGMILKVKGQLDAVPRVSKDRFHAVMETFYETASKKSTDLSNRWDKLQAAVEDTVKFYADSPGTKMEDLFGIFNQFLIDWKEGIEAIEQRRLAQEKEAKNAADAEKRKRENEEKKIKNNMGPAAGPVVAGVDKSKVVDSVMQTLSATDSKQLMAAIQARRKQNAESDVVRKQSSQSTLSRATSVAASGGMAGKAINIMQGVTVSPTLGMRSRG